MLSIKAIYVKTRCDIIKNMEQNNNIHRVMLVILDGWGVAPPQVGNAIASARTPTIDRIANEYFATTLQASGIGVGLPYSEKGNSEVGHLNIGAGRIVHQYLSRITQELRNGLFYKNPEFLNALQHAQNNNSNVHIVGLFSTGNVHGSMEHFLGLLDVAQQHNFQNIVVHPFLDGKDGQQKEALQTLQTLTQHLQPFNAQLPATVMGRMYALDRNNNWNLTQKAYAALTNDQSVEHASDPLAYLKAQYANGRTDYDIEPAIINSAPRIQDNDSIICTDFREDSVRQLTSAFVAPNEQFNAFERKALRNIYFVAMTEYEKNIPIHVAYRPPVVDMPLAQVLSEAGLRQFHISETEKYAHITYFFNGENEKPYENEERVLIRSDKNPHYDTNPLMQSATIVQQTIQNLNNYDFYLLNLANADMVGHTGNFQAAIKGIEQIDAQVKILLDANKTAGITTVITADHGNAEEMINAQTGDIITHHSSNSVPFIVVGDAFKARHPNKPLHLVKAQSILADVAPTILHIMGIEKPPQMGGVSMFT